MSDYGARAAMALNQCLPGQHRDKLVARMFGVSVRMAKYLRSGQFWTIDRLSQASAVLGAAFDAALHPSSDAVHEFEMSDIAERLARLEERIDEMARPVHARLPPEAGEPAFEPAGPQGLRLGISRGAPARGEGRALGQSAVEPPEKVKRRA